MARKVLEKPDNVKAAFLIKHLLLFLNLFEGAQKYVKYYPTEDPLFPQPAC